MIDRLLLACAVVSFVIGLSLWAGPTVLRFEAAQLNALADRIEGTETH